MENQKKTAVIKNVKLRTLELLLNQAILVKKSLMIEFKKDFMRSCSVTDSSTFMKIITIPTIKLCANDNADNVQIDTPFDFYLIKGDLIRPVFAFFSKTETVELSFDLLQNVGDDSNYTAVNMTVKGQTNEGSEIKTTIPLTNEPMSSETISSYSSKIDHLKPSPNSHEITLTESMVTEVKSLITKLNKANPNNSIYINVLITKKSITFSDRVFNITYDLDNEIHTITDSITFNIVKSDWIRLSVSKQNDIICYLDTDNNNKKVIFITPFVGAIISSLMLKVDGVQNGVIDDKEIMQVSSDINEMDSLELDMDDYDFL